MSEFIAYWFLYLPQCLALKCVHHFEWICNFRHRQALALLRHPSVFTWFWTPGSNCWLCSPHLTKLRALCYIDNTRTIKGNVENDGRCRMDDGNLWTCSQEPTIICMDIDMGLLWTFLIFTLGNWWILSSVVKGEVSDFAWSVSPSFPRLVAYLCAWCLCPTSSVLDCWFLLRICVKCKGLSVFKRQRSIVGKAWADRVEILGCSSSRLICLQQTPSRWWYPISFTERGGGEILTLQNC